MEDKIGRSELVDKICALVDALSGDNNTCLAINGAWGSGKSFVLGLIGEELSQKQEYIIIKYDAWKNTFYSDPLIAILSCVIDGIEEKLYLVNGKDRRKSVEIFHDIIEAALDVITHKYKCKWIQELKTARVNIKKIITALLAGPVDTAGLNDFKSYQKLLKETKKILNEITQSEEYIGKQTKLVILVDEIDRCLPDEQLKILERLHHLFEVKNCAVVVAINQACVVKTVQTIYGVDGYEYLRKFFDFTFRLDTSADEYLKNWLEEYIKSFEKFQIPANKAEPSVKLAYQCLLYGSEKVLDRADNRELTRYFEGVMNICNDYGWEKLKPHYVFFILVALYIRKFISPTFLKADEVFKNQNDIYGHFIKSPSNGDEMPYYDYLAKYLGFDVTKPPKELFRYLKSEKYLTDITNSFNETVYYSTQEQFPYNEMRAFLHEPTVDPGDCKELCRLVVLYGGEQER